MGNNWFEQGGTAYARFRPEYPPELASFLASVAPSTALAVDVGCGNGQLTTQLVKYFEKVQGFDPSADQIANAIVVPGVVYGCASAEQLPVASYSASLITAAQAAHWFDLPRFYAEVRRIAAPNAIVALISYGVMVLDEALMPRFNQFYQQEIGVYWPAERKLVDSGYADLFFPFAELTPPILDIVKHWQLDELLGYIGTWSAVRRANDAGKDNILQRFASELAVLWGDPTQRREIRWPINMRLGRV